MWDFAHNSQDTLNIRKEQPESNNNYNTAALHVLVMLQIR